MPIPIVTIVVPLVASQLETRVLVDACDQSFELGDCVVAEGPPEPESVVAVVSWQSATEAALRLEHPADKAVTRAERGTQVLSFAAEDDSTQRYRSLGFTIGSLASTLFDSAELGQTRSAEETQPVELPEKSVKPLTLPRSVPAVSHNPPTQVRQTAQWLGVGAGLGSGYAGMTAYAATLRGGVTLNERWLLGAGVAVGSQPTRLADLERDGLGEGVEFRFAQPMLFLGTELEGRWVALGAFLEGGLKVMSFGSTVSSEGATGIVPLVGARLALRGSGAKLRPVVSLSAATGSEVEARFTSSRDGRLTHGVEGPGRWLVEAGLLYSFEE